LKDVPRAEMRDLSATLVTTQKPILSMVLAQFISVMDVGDVRDSWRVRLTVEREVRRESVEGDWVRKVETVGFTVERGGGWRVEE